VRKNPYSNEQQSKAIWHCKIGEAERSELPKCPDELMRKAVERAYKEVTGKAPVFLFSGWAGELTEPERAVVEDRLPATPSPVKAMGAREFAENIEAATPGFLTREGGIQYIESELIRFAASQTEGLRRDRDELERRYEQLRKDFYRMLDSKDAALSQALEDKKALEIAMLCGHLARFAYGPPSSLGCTLCDMIAAEAERDHYKKYTRHRPDCKKLSLPPVNDEPSIEIACTCGLDKPPGGREGLEEK
jgi:hypothetical protein